MAKTTNQKINNQVQEAVLKFGRLLLRQGIPINNLVVFGSYAKMSARQDSDIDVCVVSPKFGKDDIDEIQFLFKESTKIDTRIEPYPASPSHFNELESPLIWEIRKDGLELAGLL